MNSIASVIVPVHNGAPFVRTAIASALAQTCQEIEIMVVDDGSIDDTWDVVGDCVNQDSRVRSPIDSIRIEASCSSLPKIATEPRRRLQPKFPHCWRPWESTTQFVQR